MLASEFSTPELAATATFWPCFWKKRITSAVVATVPADETGEVVRELLADDGLVGQRDRDRSHHRDRAAERRASTRAGT